MLSGSALLNSKPIRGFKHVVSIQISLYNGSDTKGRSSIPLSDTEYSHVLNSLMLSSMKSGLSLGLKYLEEQQAISDFSTILLLRG
jgi:hypothetical protein